MKKRHLPHDLGRQPERFQRQDFAALHRVGKLVPWSSVALQNPFQQNPWLILVVGAGLAMLHDFESHSYLLRLPDL